MVFSKLGSKFMRATAIGMAALSFIAMPLSANAATAYELGSAKGGANNVPVTVNYSGTAANAMIPKSISFTTKTGEYTVMAYCKTAEVDDLDTSISITPASSFTLTKEGGTETLNATVSQTKTTFTADDVKNGSSGTIQVSTNGGPYEDVAIKKATATGTITVNSVKAGTYKGTLVFTVS